MLDTVVTAETPEGILLELRPAGLHARFYAWLLDWLIRLAIFWVAVVIASVMGALGPAFLLILFFGLEWFYPVVFELARAGATPGKKAFGLKVVMDNGLPVTPAASIARNLLRTADFLPLAFGAAIVSMLLRADSKRLGDLAAGTMVVRRPAAAPKVAFSEVLPIAPVRPLALANQSALLALAARAPRLTPQRLDELAAMAAAVSGDAGRSGADVTARVLGVAQWVLGRRP